MNKNFSVSKFLLPISVVMMVSGAILLFLGFTSVGSNFNDSIGYLMGSLLFLGFIFFIVSLIDSSITHRRNINNNAMEQQNVVQKNMNSNWKRIGITIIIIVICFYILMAMALNGMHD